MPAKAGLFFAVPPEFYKKTHRGAKKRTAMRHFYSVLPGSGSHASTFWMYLSQKSQL